MEDRVNTKEEDGRTYGFLSMMIYTTKNELTNKHRRKKAKCKKRKIGVKCKLSGRNAMLAINTWEKWCYMELELLEQDEIAEYRSKN